jgi:drug/metabolite transporter (DMT)-like permease
MLGGIEVPLWAIGVILFTWSLPIVAAAAVFFFGKKFGRYRIPASIVVLLLGLLFIEDLVEIFF